MTPPTIDPSHLDAPDAPAAPAAPTSPTALVTGSTSGIGAATARALAADGWHVVVTGRDRDRAGSVVEDISADGGSAVFVPSDLAAGPEQVRDFAVAATEAAGGRIDALVHNAALCPAVDTVALTDDDLEATLAVNVRAPHVLTAALAPPMVERGSGGIVVIGSWMAHVGHAFVGLYSATKAAEIQLARSWAAEFGPGGVRVNTVSPGATRTPINADDGDVIARMTAGDAGRSARHPRGGRRRGGMDALLGRGLSPRRRDRRRRRDHVDPVSRRHPALTVITRRRPGTTAQPVRSIAKYAPSSSCRMRADPAQPRKPPVPVPGTM